MKCKRAAIANIKRGLEQVNWDNRFIKRNVHKFLVSCSKHGIKPVPLLDYVPYKPQNTCLIDVPTFYHKGPFWMTDNQFIKRNVHKFLVSCSKHGIKPVPLLDYVPYKPQNTCLIDVPTFYHKGPFWMTDNLKYKLILEIIFIKRISAIKD